MNDFISKPVNPEQFLEILARWVASSVSVIDGDAPEVSTRDKSSLPYAPLDHSSHIDLREISKSFRGNAGQVRNLVMIFLDTGRKALEEARIAYESRNAEGLMQIGHRFKSSSKYMGAYVFSDLMLDLESGARSGDWKRMATTLTRLNDEWNLLELELSEAAGVDASA